MSTLQKLFGQKLRQIRHQQNLTQEQLAEMATVSVDLISNIERGVNAPSFKTLEKLSVALKLPPEELFSFDQIDENDA